MWSVNLKRNMIKQREIENEIMKSTHLLKALCLVGVLCLSGGLRSNAQEAQDPTPPAGRTETPRTSADQIAHSAPLEINKASQLLGREVKNQDEERLGEIKDIVINLETGKVAYAVLSVKEGGLLIKEEKLIAVPLSAFQVSPNKEFLSLNVDKQKFSQAKGFDPNHWPSVEQPAWGAEPFWKTAPPAGKTEDDTISSEKPGVQP